MQVEIKREKPEDREEVDFLFNLVFEQEGASSIINKLRETDIYIPELSRVARINDSIIGMIMYTKGVIVRGRKHIPTVVLSGMAVLPAYQGLGVGAELIANSFVKARKMEVESALVFGQEEYFKRFGFLPASQFEITTSLDLLEDEFLALELEKNSLEGARGHLKHHSIYTELIQFNF
jgi:predicted N-acetyltransferase YhbS